MKTYVVYDLTADRYYLIKAENETDASAKLRLSFTEEQLRTEFQALVDLIAGLNKELEWKNKYVEEQLAEGRECCMTKQELVEPPTYEEFIGDYEIETYEEFILEDDITPLDQTVLMNYL